MGKFGEGQSELCGLDTIERLRKGVLEGKSLDELLLNEGISEQQFHNSLSEHNSYMKVDLDSVQIDPKFISRFPARILLERKILPIQSNGDSFAVVSNPFELAGIDELRVLTGIDLEIALAPKAEISRFIKENLGLGADTIESMFNEAKESGLVFLRNEDEDDVDLAEAAEGASIIRFVNQILTEAIEMRATDVHIEPFEDEIRVRYRIDGVLQAAIIPAEVKQFQPAIVSRLKILSHLDIAEKRVPQDGRIKIILSGREVDVRVSIIPMLHGEAVVLRLLDRSSVLLGPENIGMGKRDLTVFREIVKRPHGIILVTGPTGSGKTTTLYAALSHINDVDRKIVTIEDPIEYQLHGINQIQVSNKRGLTFARGLRSVLRHDPDVILVGEIRDLETAEIAVQASLTGHLVFSTLHTNDAPGALTRLVDMGVEPYLVASSLEAVMAQRLIRLICPNCKAQLPQKDINALRARYKEMIPEKLYYGSGCKQCSGSGYMGRTGIFELMIVSEDVRTLLLQNATPRDIRKMAMGQGMRSLRQDAIRYLNEGITSFEEILRVTKDELLVISNEDEE